LFLFFFVFVDFVKAFSPGFVSPKKPLSSSGFVPRPPSAGRYILPTTLLGRIGEGEREEREGEEEEEESTFSANTLLALTEYQLSAFKGSKPFFFANSSKNRFEFVG
jgi:hypothetical protein